MSDFKEIIDTRLRSVHSDISLDLFQQLSQFIDNILIESISIKEEEKITHLTSSMLKIKKFLETEVANENVRKVIRDNLSREYEDFSRSKEESEGLNPENKTVE